MRLADQVIPAMLKEFAMMPRSVLFLRTWAKGERERCALGSVCDGVFASQAASVLSAQDVCVRNSLFVRPHILCAAAHGEVVLGKAGRRSMVWRGRQGLFFFSHRNAEDQPVRRRK